MDPTGSITNISSSTNHLPIDRNIRNVSSKKIRFQQEDRTLNTIDEEGKTNLRIIWYIVACYTVNVKQNVIRKVTITSFFTEENRNNSKQLEYKSSRRIAKDYYV